ncbi:MAG: cobalamin-dependent protein [Ignavibacteriae bacterium]|nr:cobalamin-dependent protein [Ignavibacteriota bacterium]
MILLYNPRSCDAKYRIPNTLLTLGATIEGKYDYRIVDGNWMENPLHELEAIVRETEATILGMTVMPGPQLMQAIDLTKHLKSCFADLTVIWGGYFPSNHTEVVARADYVDFIVTGQGEEAFPKLLEAIGGNFPFAEVPNLVWRHQGETIHNPKAPLTHPNQLPALPYHRINANRYAIQTVLGKRTLSYHSSYGCPYECSFCAIVPIYKARWLGRDGEKVADDVEMLVNTYGADSIEFHDNNFFTSEKRVATFAREILRRGLKVGWWGEGRPDQLLKYSDETFELMARSGLKMVFMGAESGDDETLKAMNKGGTQTSRTIVEIVERMKKYGIVPECSFVLGTPSDDVDGSIRRNIEFIRQLKEVNAETEIIIYIYSPIPLDGADLYETARATGFTYPETLEDWQRPEWASFDLRRNPLTPWLKPEHIRHVRNFEAVLNARYPTNSDIKLKSWQVTLMKLLGSWRYAARFYHLPYEIKLAQRSVRYRQPEIEGF